MTTLHSGTNAVREVLKEDPDLVILDIMLPGKDGLAVCREIRAQSNVPIILESARVEELDKLFGLELGADDYVCKPWSPRELVARAKAILRRVQVHASQHQERGLHMNGEGWTTYYNSQLVDLTRREFQLLNTLFRHPGRVFSRAQLIEIVFPDDIEIFDRTIDSHIKNIRAKLKKAGADSDLIRSVYGVGYVC